MPVHRALVLLALALGVGVAGSLSAEDGRKGGQTEVTVRGKVACLHDSGQALRSCAEAPERFAIRTDEGRLYPFLADDQRAEIFKEPQVREKEIQVSGLLREGALEIVQLHSIRNGRLYDMYYRCEVCDITAYAPGPCWCCWQDFEFRETPAKSSP